LGQPVSRMGIEKLATTLRTSPGRVMRRADELGVSLVPRYHDEAVDTGAYRCTDGLVDPLLERLNTAIGSKPFAHAQSVPSVARVAAGAFGFLILIQVFDGPDR
jgi:hypothetical protein